VDGACSQAADDVRHESGSAAQATLTEREVLFIGERDSVYLASLCDAGWPYVQHLGGPAGFIRALDPNILILPDFARMPPAPARSDGAASARVAMIFMDYRKRRSLTVRGCLAFTPSRPRGTSTVERIGVITVTAFDWNSPGPVTQRYSAIELLPLTQRVAALEAENAMLQAQLAAKSQSRH
jgi:hypothetical protein